MFNNITLTGMMLTNKEQKQLSSYHHHTYIIKYAKVHTTVRQ